MTRPTVSGREGGTPSSGTPGTGNAHRDGVFRGPEDADHSGALVTEPFVAVNEANIGAAALWRDLVGDPDVLVADGFAFPRATGSERGPLG